MALVDVTELLEDPDFLDDITVIRRPYTINAYGENVLSEVTYTMQASVQAGSGQLLKRLPDFAQFTDAITVYAKFDFQAASPNGYADLVIWNSKRYNIKVPSDYMNYGDGYTMAIATIEAVNNG